MKLWDRLRNKGVAGPPCSDLDDFGGASRPAQEDDIYHGALAASVVREWAGDIIPPLRRALASAGVDQATSPPEGKPIAARSDGRLTGSIRIPSERACGTASRRISTSWS